MTFDEAKKKFKRFPEKSKLQKLIIERDTYLPLERKEAKKLNLRPLYKSADRMFYDRPVDRNARDVIDTK